jgi:hypothetical protein
MRFKKICFMVSFICTTPFRRNFPLRLSKQFLISEIKFTIDLLKIYMSGIFREPVLCLDIGLIEDTYTQPERTQNSIYLRLEYDKPSGTVTNVRKSMWIHPKLDRAISIRETARLQTFPDTFVIIGSKDSQYQQVGNAVPPLMAKAIAKKLAVLLEACLADSALQRDNSWWIPSRRNNDTL